MHLVTKQYMSDVIYDGSGSTAITDVSWRNRILLLHTAFGAIRWVPHPYCHLLQSTTRVTSRGDCHTIFCFWKFLQRSVRAHTCWTSQMPILVRTPDAWEYALDSKSFHCTHVRRTARGVNGPCDPAVTGILCHGRVRSAMD